jgi:hypothetical protein
MKRNERDEKESKKDQGGVRARISAAQHEMWPVNCRETLTGPK